MPRTPLILVMLALTCSGLLAQKQFPAAQKPKQTLFDFRPNRNSAPPRIPAATQSIVLSKVFRKYLTSETKCNPKFNPDNSSDPLKAARNSGQIVPTIVDMAAGSFTSSGQIQVAYVISVGECNASHADNYGTKRVAIFSGQRLIADMDVDFRGTVVRKTDLNGDGIDELLMTTGDMNQGTLIEMAALVDFQNGRFRVIQDFGTVTEDSCASEMPGSSAKASVISIGPWTLGRMPRLIVDNYSARCRKVKQWRFLSTGKMPD
jgi:hypothetical protein